MQKQMASSKDDTGATATLKAPTSSEADVNDITTMMKRTLRFDGRYRGCHEIDLCPEDAPSPSRVLNCEKRGRHKEYIPYNQFSILSLPDRYRDNNLVQIVHVLAYLTVKITVRYVSNERPAKDDIGEPYPLADMKGSTNARNGTGRIGTVWSYTEADNKLCPCTECKKSGTPRKEWGQIRVITAVHVVYDESEALQSECRFGYDSLDDSKTPIIFEGFGMERADENDDRCHLLCATHDISLVGKIKPQWSKYPNLHKRCTAKFTDPTDKLVVMVAHPHGCPKQVSIGEWTHRDELGTKSSEGHPYVKYNYTTPTCPGSSGATLYVIGRKWALWYNQVHGGFDKNINYNYSGTGCD